MTPQNASINPQLMAVTTTNLAPMIRMAGFLAPRALAGFLQTLSVKQRKAVDQVMPVGRGKQFFIHITDSPTPPILIELAQPMKLTTHSVQEVEALNIKGLRLCVDDLQLLSGGMLAGSLLKFAWRIKGQFFTALSLAGIFWPVLRLGPAELRDIRGKAMKHFKPLIDLMPSR
jgi:hypothetical protein